MKKTPRKKFLTDPFNHIEIILESMNDKIGLLANGQTLLFEKVERLEHRMDEHFDNINKRVSVLEIGQFALEQEMKKIAKKLFSISS